jgi:hypothetical protein
MPRGSCLVQSTSCPTNTTWMNDIDQGNVDLIEWMRLGSLASMGPLVRPINRHNRHSKAILGVPERRWFVTQHGVGPAAPPNRHTGRNRRKELTLNRLKSIQGERRWITGLAAALIWPHLSFWSHTLNRPPLSIKVTLDSLDWTHSAGASHFLSFVHVE